jgi:hypothetical protein
MVIGAVPLDRESLLSALCVFRRRAIRKTVSSHGTLFVNDNTSRVQRIEAEVLHQDRDVRSDLYRGARPVKAYTDGARRRNKRPDSPPRASESANVSPESENGQSDRLVL